MPQVLSTEVYGQIFKNLPLSKLYVVSTQCSQFYTAAVPYIFSHVTCHPLRSGTPYSDSSSIDRLSEHLSSHEPDGVLEFFHNSGHLCHHVHHLRFQGFRFEEDYHEWRPEELRDMVQLFPGLTMVEFIDTGSLSFFRHLIPHFVQIQCVIIQSTSIDPRFFMESWKPVGKIHVLEDCWLEDMDKTGRQCNSSKTTFLTSLTFGYDPSDLARCLSHPGSTISLQEVQMLEVWHWDSNDIDQMMFQLFRNLGYLHISFMEPHVGTYPLPASRELIN